MKKFLIYSGIIIAILLLLYFGLSFWLVRGTAAAVEAKRQAIRDAGDKVYLTDYETDPIPDEENAYYYLMLAKADLEAFDNDLENASELQFEYERRLRPEEVDELANIIDKYPQMFERLEQAAACENYRPNVRYEDGLAMLLPHAHLMRTVARALSAKALVKAYRGDGDAALEQCRLALRLSAHLRYEPTMVSNLVMIACQGIVIFDANHVLRVADTSPDARRRLDEALVAFDNRKATIDALKGERAMGILTFQQMRDGTLDPDDLGARDASRFSVVSSTWLGQAYLNDDEAKYIEVLNRQIETAELPKREREKAMQPVWNELEASSVRHLFSQLLAPMLSAAVEASDRAEAANRCLRVLLAIEGRDDVDIEGIDLPDSAKIDPFSGQPLLLTRKDDEWLVYSVGPNLLDDGGTVHQLNKQLLDIGLAPLLEPLEAAEDAIESYMP